MLELVPCYGLLVCVLSRQMGVPFMRMLQSVGVGYALTSPARACFGSHDQITEKFVGGDDISKVDLCSTMPSQVDMLRTSEICGSM